VPRKCSLCIHERRYDIEQAMLAGGSYRVVAQRFAVSRDAVVRHRRHLPAVLARAQEVKEVAHGDSLLAQLRDLTAEAQRLKAIAEEAGDYRAALAAVRELCRIVELMAKLSGDLDSHSETKILHVTLDAETALRISKTFLARHQPPVEIT
jgi:3-methyladenine DNA glycosylase Tag